jgi:nucleoside-diphosphate-sugar epimerase
MNVLIIGGTRNVGFFLAMAMHEAGHRVTILNRGITRDELPPAIERLRADRTDAAALKRALSGRSFDAVVDATLYNADEAKTICDLLHKRAGHYIFLSSGQVYLVRDGLARPFHERDYEGRLLPAPKPDTYAYEEWLYGMNKRNAEDVFLAAAKDRKFPVTILRLPMVNGERDHFHRLYSYVLRLQDGGPILVPTTPNYPLRHIYSDDVVRAIIRILESGSGKGKAYNISQDESVSLEAFLGIVGGLLGVEPQIVRVNRDLLEANGFLPDCSPFSERWMSEPDNSLSKTELGITYTPLPIYLERIIRHYETHKPPKPTGYRRRRSEIKLVETMPAVED